MMNYDLDTEDGMANAVRWTTSVFDTLKSGGVWAVPRSGTMVTIDKENKTAIIYAGHSPDPSITRVIKAMGWTVDVR